MTWDVCSLNKHWTEDRASGSGRRGQQLGGAHSPTEETLTGRAEAPRPGAPEASFSAMTGGAGSSLPGRSPRGRPARARATSPRACSWFSQALCSPRLRSLASAPPTGSLSPCPGAYTALPSVPAGVTGACTAWPGPGRSVSAPVTRVQAHPPGCRAVSPPPPGPRGVRAPRAKGWWGQQLGLSPRSPPTPRPRVVGEPSCERPSRLRHPTRWGSGRIVGPTSGRQALWVYGTSEHSGWPCPLGVFPVTQFPHRKSGRPPCLRSVEPRQGPGLMTG